VDVLSSRILLHPADLGRSRQFYRDVLGLAVYREFGPQADPPMVFFLGGGLLEISGPAASPPGQSVQIWLQRRPSEDHRTAFFETAVPVLAASGKPAATRPLIIVGHIIAAARRPGPAGPRRSSVTKPGYRP